MCGKRSKFKFGLRYKHPETPATLRLIYAEPMGYHQGARLKAARPIDRSYRQWIISEKSDAREKLLAMV